MFEITKYPSKRINPTGECLEIGYTSNKITGNLGSAATLVIPSDVFNNIMFGSRIIINNSNFVYATGSQQDNTIPITSDANTNANGLLSILSKNFELSRIVDFNNSLVNNASITITLKNCSDNIEVEVQDLANGMPDLIFAATPTPYRAQDNYHVKVIIYESSQFDNLPEPLKLTPAVILKPSLCSVESYEISKDIKAIVSPLVYTHLPDLSNNQVELIRLQLDRIKTIFIESAEAYGTPLNVFGLTGLPNKTTEIINYTPYPNDLESPIEKRYNHFGSDDPIFFSAYKDGDNVSPCQNNFVHYLIYEDSNFDRIEYFADVYTASGTYTDKLIYSKTRANFIAEYDGERPEGIIAELKTGLPQIKDRLNSHGINVGHITSYTIKCRCIIDDAPEKESSVYYVVDRLKTQITELVFLGFEGAYQTIPFHYTNEISLLASRESVASCKPCTTSQLQEKTVSVSSAMQIELKMFEHFFYSKRVLREFFLSKDIYLRLGEKLFYTQIIDENILLSDAPRDGKVNVKVYGL